jgi:hypothetical protein
MRIIIQIMLVLVILLFSVFFSNQGAEAATYYVATTGNDTGGDGSIAKPWLTVPKGLRSLRAGDTLYIRGGLYNIANTYGVAATDTYGCVPTCPTSWAAATKVMNYPGERVVINHRGFNMDNSIASGGVAYFIWQGDQRANFVHQMYGTDGDITAFRVNHATHHIRLQTMTIMNFNSHGITGGMSTNCTLKPTFIEVLDNEVRNNGDDSYNIAHEHGIYPACGEDWSIDGNYFVGNFAYGVHVNAKNSHRFTITRNTIEGRKGPTGTAAGIYITGGNGHIVMNNLIIGKGAQAFKLALGVQVGPAAVNPVIYNNTVFDVATGIQLSSPTGAMVQNNLLSAVTNNIQDLGNNTKASNLCTVVEPGCSVITATPRFVSAGSNFRLAQGSLAIDAGATLSVVTHDLDRGTRPKGNAHDIGAFESGSQTSPKPPSNLQVR